jgi:hypothetical protein
VWTVPQRVDARDRAAKIDNDQKERRKRIDPEVRSALQVEVLL